MGNLTDVLPQESPTVAAIMAHYKKNGESKPRDYLGASIIGAECERMLWYGFRHCANADFDGRMFRLFATGHLEEPRMIADLRAIGCEVHEVGEDGKQFGFVAVAGHVRGHMDGCAKGIPEAPEAWHVLEFKTHGAKSFAGVKGKGVKAAKPEHYAQIMAYMHLSGMHRALYLAKNKDTDELYAERVRYDASEAKLIMEKAERVVRAAMPPERISESADDFRCKFCPAKELCHGGTPSTPAVPLPALSCRQCVHATPEMDTETGRWSCALHKRSLSRRDQDKACPDHLLIPGLVRFAEAVDGDYAQGWIEYENRSDKARWRNGKAHDQFSSADLMIVPAKIVAAGHALPHAKEAFAGKLVGYEAAPLAQRYPLAECRQMWTGSIVDVEAAWTDAYGESPLGMPPVSEGEYVEGCRGYEYPGGRVLVVHEESGNAIILEGVE